LKVPDQDQAGQRELLSLTMINLVLPELFSITLNSLELIAPPSWRFGFAFSGFSVICILNLWRLFQAPMLRRAYGGCRAISITSFGLIGILSPLSGLLTLPSVLWLFWSQMGY
jgi:hypothetical protein